jgi:hypothetical protein
VLEALDEERLGGMVKGAIANRLRAMEVAPLLGQHARAPITEDRHIPMLDASGRLGRPHARRQRGPDPRHGPRAANWIMRSPASTSKLADAIVDGLRKLTIDMALDPDHPVRAEGRGGAGAARLEAPARSRRRRPRSRLEERDHRQQGGRPTGSTACGKSRAGLLKAARDPDATLAGKFGEALRQLGETLQRTRASQGRSTSSPAAPWSAPSPLMAAASSPWSPTRSAAGTPRPSPAASKPPSAATSNISASTAPSSAAWSAS